MFEQVDYLFYRSNTLKVIHKRKPIYQFEEKRFNFIAKITKFPTTKENNFPLNYHPLASKDRREMPVCFHHGEQPPVAFH